MKQTQMIVYIAGQGRSGTTLLGRILGQDPKVAFIGEAMHIWDQWDRADIRCGAGEPLQRCAMWRVAMGACCSDLDIAARRRLFEAQTRACRTMLIPSWAFEWSRVRKLGSMRPYLARLGSLYEALLSSSGAAVVVDSSKVPAYATLVRAATAIEVYVLHLVRDPRAVAHSWTRQRPKTPHSHGLMQTHHPINSAVRWNAYNLGIPWLHRNNRYLRVAYESLASHPKETVDRIATFLGVKLAIPDDSGTVVLEPSHALSGNPMRFHSGALGIRPDDEWVVSMPAWQRISVGALTWPLRRRLS